ncbi:hypothetical protein LX64_02555 [Chitinophaga skermanii]|uniref:Lipocalin-like protein n=1 Tax=Chitinophaga skermanii TaxID=331697 RepID=A0A327QUI4_9BACT|nr:hypothetical protein [Chitinophaga skermanii]RAJ05397.1 hypothetical protein LX64_02555 [Chitinophaga skermanii]
MPIFSQPQGNACIDYYVLLTFTNFSTMIKKWLISSAFLTAFLCTACSKSDDNSTPPVNTAAPTSGTWRVTLFSERGENNTSKFNGYTFTFNRGGTATAMKDAITKNGTWSFGNSNRRYNIDFGVKTDSNKPLGELTDDWVIVEVSTTKITLKDDNESSNEQLVFTKN